MRTARAFCAAPWSRFTNFLRVLRAKWRDHKISLSPQLKVALLVGAIVASAALVLKVLVHVSPDELEAHSDEPAPDYETALEWFEQLQAQETAMDGLDPVCLSTMLTHGHKMERAIVLMHGMLNCPAQFRTLAPLFFERGYNVLIPRMPGKGYADPDTEALKDVTAEELRNYCNDMVDLARGLGDHVTYFGLSAGGTMAAWVAQNRADVDLAVLVAPDFTISRGLGVTVSKVVMYLFRITPDLMTQRVRPFTGAVGHNYHGFATRGLAQSMRLGLSVFDAAKSRKPAAQSILVVTNAADPAVKNTITRQLVQRWQANGMQQLSTYEFLANYHLIHDVIDPNQQKQQTALVYPILLDLIAQEKVV